MYYFYIEYSDNTFTECEHVVSVSYNGYDQTETITGDDIATHNFPTNMDLWLRTSNSTLAINGKNIRSIELKKE